MNYSRVAWAGFNALDPFIFRKSHGYSNVGVFNFSCGWHRECPRELDHKVRLSDRPIINKGQWLWCRSTIAYGGAAIHPIRESSYLRLPQPAVISEISVLRIG